jgi:phosphoribosylformylglycinamidine (FGAM) synthase-like enzyme
MNDHDALEKSGILPVLEELLQSKDLDISGLAESLTELLVARCVGLEVESDIASDRSDEPSSFSRKLAKLLVNRLEVSY